MFRLRSAVVSRRIGGRANFSLRRLSLSLSPPLYLPLTSSRAAPATSEVIWGPNGYGGGDVRGSLFFVLFLLLVAFAFADRYKAVIPFARRGSGGKKGRRFGCCSCCLVWFGVWRCILRISKGCCWLMLCNAHVNQIYQLLISYSFIHSLNGREVNGREMAQPPIGTANNKDNCNNNNNNNGDNLSSASLYASH